MGRRSFSWEMLKREASLAAKYAFGDGTYDLSDPTSLKQLGLLCLLAGVMFLLVLWVNPLARTLRTRRRTRAPLLAPEPRSHVQSRGVTSGDRAQVCNGGSSFGRWSVRALSRPRSWSRAPTTRDIGARVSELPYVHGCLSRGAHPYEAGR
jgi:hypothetical protein